VSRFRNVHTKLWKSADFRALSPLKPSGQALFFYLLTGTHTTAVPGVLVAGPAAIAEELGWKPSEVRKYINEIAARGMAVEDAKVRLIYLPAGLAHNRPTNPNIVRSWRDEWAMVPACALRDRMEADFGTFLGSLGDHYAQAWASVARNVPSNVPGGFGVERSTEQSSERSVDGSTNGSEEPSTEGSLRTRTRTQAVPVSAPDSALRSGGGAGGAGGDPASAPVDAAWIVALVTAGAEQESVERGLRNGGRATLTRWWADAMAKGTTWEDFVSALKARAARWYDEATTAGKGQVQGGWAPHKLPEWEKDREAKAKAGGISPGARRGPPPKQSVPSDLDTRGWGREEA